VPLSLWNSTVSAMDADVSQQSATDEYGSTQLPLRTGQTLNDGRSVLAARAATARVHHQPSVLDRCRVRRRGKAGP
jgi:hypothetical protein